MQGGKRKQQHKWLHYTSSYACIEIAIVVWFRGEQIFSWCIRTQPQIYRIRKLKLLWMRIIY